MKSLTAGQKAAITRNRNFEAMTPSEKAKVTCKRKAAAKKAWGTIRANEKKEKHSAAAKKAWKTIRANKKASQSNTEDRIKLLETLPNWKWDIDLDLKWNEKFKAVKTFVQKNNKYPNNPSKDKEEKNLGNWIANQKTFKKQGKITEDRIKMLEALPNWKWDTENKWMENYEKVKSFIADNARHPSVHSENNEEKTLGAWIASQKMKLAN
jgi:hypothetical protein